MCYNLFNMFSKTTSKNKSETLCISPILNKQSEIGKTCLTLSVYFSPWPRSDGLGVNIMHSFSWLLLIFLVIESKNNLPHAQFT